MIPAAFVNSPIKITLKGGTDVRWSPPVDYLINMTRPILESIGLSSKNKSNSKRTLSNGGWITKGKNNSN
jgi:RNA 3'-terminal phosphate cyclase (ATP)